ncbi:MAG: hypothetical protein OEZ02_05615 [Anaerolineae bacterium]|nr:hypothetical protein [Anaerolineae bacterium]
MVKMVERSEYRPEIGSRQSEITAWVLTGMTMVVALVLGQGDAGLSPLLTWLLVFFSISAVLISFGNWVDRNTLLVMDDQGVHFCNGLRNVKIEWDKISQVTEFPGRETSKVHVWSSNARFTFRKPVNRSGNLGNINIGFKDGQKIMEIIILKAGLVEKSQSSNIGYYYTRK